MLIRLIAILTLLSMQLVVNAQALNPVNSRKASLAAPLLYKPLPDNIAAQPFINHYKTGSLIKGASSQNYCISQDERGNVIVGNDRALLIFNGSHWEIIDNKPTRCVQTGVEGLLYTANNQDFGYYNLDDWGNWKYESLISKIPVEDHSTGAINGIFADRLLGKVIYTYEKLIAIWDGNKLSYIKATRGSSFQAVSKIIDQYLVLQRGKGLMTLEADELTLIEQGASFKDIKNSITVPYNDHNTLIITNSAGLFLHDGKRVKALRTDIDPYIQGLSFTAATSLPGSYIALGTVEKGVFIIDRKGKLITMINQSNGLPENIVIDLFNDQQGYLWITGNQGVLRVELASTLRKYDKTGGLNGKPNSMAIYNDSIWVATMSGVYGMPVNPITAGQRAAFKKLDIPAKFNSDLLVVDEQLLIATEVGVYTYQSGSFPKIASRNGKTFELFRSSFYPNRVYLSTGNSVASIVRDSVGWTYEVPYEGIGDRANYFVEDQDNSIWFASGASIYRIDQQASNGAKRPELNKVDFTSAKDKASINGLLKDQGNLIVLQNGAFSYNLTTKKLDPLPAYDNALPTRINNNGWGYLNRLNDFESEIFTSDNEAVAFTDEATLWPNTLLDKPSEITALISTKDGVWISGVEQILFYSNKSPLAENDAFQCNLSQILINQDSTIFSGTYYPELFSHGALHNLTLPYSQRDVSFEFTSPAFDLEKKNQYQFNLEGYSREWTEWSYESDISYTNLPPGTYTLQARALNANGRKSELFEYTFKVERPWFMTWWAYVLYAIVFIAAVMLIIRWRTQRVRRENVKLENLVTERTEELVTAKEQLFAQEKLASLGQVTAGIAHEIQNPINFVKNFAELNTDLLQELEEEVFADDKMSPEEKLDEAKAIATDVKENLSKISEHGSKAGLIVKSMLEHTTVGSGNREKAAINQLVQSTVKNFLQQSELAQKLKLELIESYDTKQPETEIITKDLVTALDNILDNSIYALHEKQLSDPAFSAQLSITTTSLPEKVIVTIKDNGIGISDADLGDIFNPFFTTKPTGFGNTGLGLSLAHDIIANVHGGSLTAESEQGVYTTLITELPT